MLIGVLTLTGMALKMSSLILDVGAGSLFLTLLTTHFAIGFPPRHKRHATGSAPTQRAPTLFPLEHQPVGDCGANIPAVAGQSASAKRGPAVPETTGQESTINDDRLPVNK